MPMGNKKIQTLNITIKEWGNQFMMITPLLEMIILEGMQAGLLDYSSEQKRINAYSLRWFQS